MSLLATAYAYAQAQNPFNELRGVAIPTPQWIVAKATCETGPNPRDRGTYAGMFGIMHRGTETDNSGLPNNSSWGRWGGFELAPRPNEATPLEQTLIYLRINYAGWHRPNGMYRPPSSRKENLCTRHADNATGGHDLETLNDPAAFLAAIETELEQHGVQTR